MTRRACYYETHGLFTVVLSATDESGNEASTSVIVRIDKTTDWTQSNTDNPDSMVLSATHDCLCPAPERIELIDHQQSGRYSRRHARDRHMAP